MNWRRVALLLGVGALGIAWVSIQSPAVIGLSAERSVLLVIGTLLLVQALRHVQSRRHAQLTEASLPDPERSTSVDPPGADVGTALSQFSGVRASIYDRNRIREGLRTAARAVLRQYRGYDPGEVAERLDAGEWTDDPIAAAYLGTEDAGNRSVSRRILEAIRGGSTLHREIRQTVVAIAEIAGISSDWTERSGPRRPPRGDSPDGVDTRQPEGGPLRADSDPGRDTAEKLPRDEPYETGHWRGIGVIALVGIGLGLVMETGTVLLTAIVGIGFAAYARSSSPPPAGVTIDRSVDTPEPEPEETVEVTVTIANESGRFQPDLRVVDGVPSGLGVSGGSPRCGTALRRGERTEFSYEVTARRGTHEFHDAELIARSLTGSIEVSRAIETDTAITCVPTLRTASEAVPLAGRGTEFVGEMPGESSGTGVEFFATREYQPGDARNRIDWNRRARTGELTTIEFRQERAATVVIVIDARPVSYVAPDRDSPHAVDRMVSAAGTVFTSLLRDGHRVGISVLGSEPCWLAPGAGIDHRIDARQLLGAHPALSPSPPESKVPLFDWRRQLKKRLPTGAQLVVLSPLTDGFSAGFARRFAGYGHPTSVVSPDATIDRPPWPLLAKVARKLRITELRNAGVTVVDWDWDEPLEAAFARYQDGRHP